MKLSRMQLAELLSRRLQGNQPLTAKQIAAYLVETGQTGQLESLTRDIQAIRAEAGVVELTAATAHPLDDAAKTSIRRLVKELRPETKQVIINQERNQRLIGGMKLRLPYYELDLSLRGRLNQFKQSLNAERSA